uniref:starch synthase n=1 Tax=Anthurium amnicola TaxID=1678845 RepID=A0A1D1XIW6_9ARAE
MEMAFHTRGPVYCRGAPLTGSLGFRIGSDVRPLTRSTTCCKEFLRVRTAPRMLASSDYPRRPRRSLIPKTKGTTPKGFAPRPQVGTSTQKKDQGGKEEGAALSGSSEQTPQDDNRAEVVSVSPTRKIPDTLEEVEEEDVGTEYVEGISSIESTIKHPDHTDSDEFGEDTVDRKKDERFSRTKHTIDEKWAMANSRVDATELGKSSKIELVTHGIDKIQVAPKSSLSTNLDKFETGKAAGVPEATVDIYHQSDRITPSEDHSISIDRDEHITETGNSNTFDDIHVREWQDVNESLVKQKIEMDPQAQKQMLKELAEENLSRESKVFVFPQVVQSNQVIQVFLNRSVSTLLNEPDVFIMGAFNDWRWKSFKEKLHKTDLNGDWWSCQIHVPKEAYKIDFVFFNGGHIYENNDYKDFHLAIEGGMDVSAFEDFLLEEKRRELEKLAQERAERERLAEEERRKEEEKAGREADKAQAKMEVEKGRQSLHHVMKKAVTSVDNLWHIEPNLFKGEDKVRLFYNRSSRPLAHATEIWIHGGYNNWKDGPSIAERLFRSEKKDGDWWYADVVIPDRALVMDWVFADGPPQNAKVYDNNNHQDFHAIVPNCISEELYWAEEEHQIYRKLQEERKIKVEAVSMKAEKAARMKAETKAKTMRSFLLSQKHIVYTEPLDVQAGKTVAVFYNPSHTVLNGKPDIWLRCSFNRWTHRAGPLPPQRMVPTGNGSHVKATVKVPLDAYMMDFVFSDREDGGMYDNKNGMDYHIPVTGGLHKEPPMHIVHVAVEMAPIAKVGGLGDVVTSLSRAVQDIGHNVEIILPKYDCMNLSNVKDFQFNRNFVWGGTEINVWFGKVESLPVYFLEPKNGMFWVGGIYSGRNDAERFGFFCHAALEFLLQRGSHPDILHCHDWSSAPVAWLFKEHYRHYGLSDARVIFTIHNLEFGVHFIGKAMTNADKATTVSQTYSREVSGNPAIAPHLHKFHGILNGIDPDIWDPYSDNFIPVPYTSVNVVQGKRAAKEALQQRLGLRRSEYPIVGIITRLTVQKGIHLIKHAIWHTLERNGQVVLLGSAPDPRIQNDFSNLANQLHSSHGDCIRLCLTYDEPLSHLIYAGSDFILVPSIFEPCGLTQLIAMRYGSIPVVRRTGGLYDTVFDVDRDKERAKAQGLEPNGFSFDGTDSAGVEYALNRALSAWYDGRDWFNSLCQRVMEQDWSWNRPALDYMELYYSARK